ncbi:MAG: DciA family protein [Gammaproteobacteria bacterium]|nr:DciA family protein [Gammaproteobacteria bacterium]
MAKTTHQHLQTILSQSHGDLGKLLQVVTQLQALNKLVQIHLPDAFKKYVRVLNLNQGKLILEVDNSSQAAKLRFALPELLSSLRKTREFAGLKNIEQQIAVKTHKTLGSKQAEPSEFKLSPEATECLLSSIDSSSDDKLKKTLAKFLTHYGVNKE